MSKTPLVAIFTPDSDSQSLLAEIPLNAVCNLREVEQKRDIIAGAYEGEALVDIILVPPVDKSGVSAAERCKELAEHDLFSSFPVFLIDANPETEPFPGADCVIAPGITAAELTRLFSAIASRKRTFDAKLAKVIGSVSGDDFLFGALNAITDGIALVSPEGALVHHNSALALLAGVNSQEFAKQQDVLSDSVNGFLSEHKKGSHLTPNILTDVPAWSVFPSSLAQADGTQISVVVYITAIPDQSGMTKGFALIIRDATEHQLLAQTRRTSLRMRRLGLITAIAARLASSMIGSDSPLSPVTLYSHLSAKEESEARVSESVEALLEILDPVLASSIGVGVSIDSSHSAPIRPSELVQLLGELTLYAGDFTGPQGSISIESSIEGGKILIVVRGSAPRRTTVLFDKELETILSGSFDGKSSVPGALGPARTLAESYNGELEYKQDSTNNVEMILSFEA